jgi:hypothetical protein
VATLRFVNDTGGDVFVDATYGDGVRVEDRRGTPLGRAEWCGTDCETCQRPVCGSPLRQVRRIAGGGVYETRWAGDFYETAPGDKGCTCSRQRFAEDGTYTVTLSGRTAATGLGALTGALPDVLSGVPDQASRECTAHGAVVLGPSPSLSEIHWSCTAAAPLEAGARDAAALTAAPQPDAAILAAPADPRCTGSAIDLTSVLLNHLCAVPRDLQRAVDPGAVRVTAAGPKRLRPGEEGDVVVTLTNITALPLELLVAEPLDAGSSLRIGPGAGATSAKPPETIPLEPSIASADGKRSFDRPWALLTALPSHDLVRLDPGGAAQLRTTLVARGFLPGKRYEPSGFGGNAAPDPLPPGPYRVTLRLPLATRDIVSATFDLEVR